MMQLQQYLQQILDEQGFDAYMKEEDYMWELYEQEDDFQAFDEYCLSVGVEPQGESVVHWAWDMCGE